MVQGESLIKFLDEQKLEVLKLKLAKCVPNSAFFGFYQPPFSPAMDIATLSSNLQLLSSNESIAFNECYDISSPSFKQMMEIHCKNLSLHSEEIDNIEKRRHGQSSNEQWKREHMYRITSSNFYLPAVNTVEPSSKLKAMFYKPFSTSATGNKYERHARELYTIFLKEKGINAHVSDVGLILSSSYSYLGASLDGIVTHKNEKFFYCRAVLPELFTKRIKQGLKLYLHGGWTNFH